MHSDDLSADAVRRRLLLAAGTAALGGLVRSASAQSGWPTPKTVDEGVVSGEQVQFPSIHAETERPGGGPPNQDAPDRRIGFAIMGLGRLAVENILPAFAGCKHARLAALVSGDTTKLRAVAQQYGIPSEACYSYQDFAGIRMNAAVEVVYVVLPNSLHHEAVLESAAAGKHVLCEKPMATSVDEARSMVDACRKAERKLMIAYRCQYENYNQELARRARAGEFGRVQIVDAINTQNQGDPSQWRQNKALAGGGSLPDVGLYCLNTTRALLGEEPSEVSAHIFTLPSDARFTEVEGTVSFTLRFPSGVIANCFTSYSVHEHRNIRVLGDQATAEVINAFGYSGQRLKIYKRDGKADTSAELTFPERNQFSLEIDHMASCVRDDVRPRTPGEEGLQDHILMAAIYRSAYTGQPVPLSPITTRDTFRGPPPLGS